jgi:hypothetical protein
MSRLTGAPSVFTSVGAGSMNAAAAADLAHLGMQVTPENIVAVSSVLRAESDYLRARVYASGRSCWVGEPGHDPVSPMAAAGFNNKIDMLLHECHAYCDRLAAASEELAATARSYGHTEEDIAGSLRAVRASYGQPGSPRVGPATGGTR